MITLFVNITLLMIQMKKPELYKPPNIAVTNGDENTIAFYLLARILRLMFKFKMKSQESISQHDAREMAKRIVARTR